MKVAAWIIVIAMMAALIGFVLWSGWRLTSRWRSGVLTSRQIVTEVLGVIAAVIVIAWGAAIAP